MKWSLMKPKGRWAWRCLRLWSLSCTSSSAVWHFFLSLDSSLKQVQAEKQKIQLYVRDDDEFLKISAKIVLKINLSWVRVVSSRTCRENTEEGWQQGSFPTPSVRGVLRHVQSGVLTRRHLHRPPPAHQIRQQVRKTDLLFIKNFICEDDGIWILSLVKGQDHFHHKLWVWVFVEIWN